MNDHKRKPATKLALVFARTLGGEWVCVGTMPRGRAFAYKQEQREAVRVFRVPGRFSATVAT